MTNSSKFLRVKSRDAQAMVDPITEAEILQSINKLKRHKTGETTGLNHEFYKDFADLLTPSLTIVFCKETEYLILF